MSVAVGLGLMEFPFSGMSDYWRWVDMCEAGGMANAMLIERFD